MANNGTVTPDGDIVVHNKGTLSYTVSFQNGDGSMRDVSDRVFYFTTNTGIRAQLMQGVNPWEKVLVIPPELLKIALKVVTEFAVVDETDALHVVEWDGRIHVKGW